MIVKSTIRKKNERGRWNFAVNAALRAPSGTAVVIEGLDPNTLHSASESIRHRKEANLIAIEWKGLLVVYKPSEDFLEHLDEKPYLRGKWERGKP